MKGQRKPCWKNVMWSEQQLFYEKKNSSQDGEVTRDRKKTRILEALNENGRIHDTGRNN